MTHPYWPMSDDSTLHYSVFLVSGTWNDATSQFTVTSRTPAPYTPQSITWGRTTCPSFFGSAPLYTESYNGSPGMMEGGATVNGVSYIGEFGLWVDCSQITIPPEAKLPINPVVGQEITATSRVYNADKTLRQLMRWRQRTISSRAWGPWPDCWLTGLREYNTEIISTVPDMVYNYAFARDIGLVNFWYGSLSPDGTVTGREYYFVGYQ